MWRGARSVSYTHLTLLRGVEVERPTLALVLLAELSAALVDADGHAHGSHVDETPRLPLELSGRRGRGAEECGAGPGFLSRKA